MLLNDFFFLSDLKKETETINAAIEINTDHKIFDGHFPGQPVVPGVCMLQIMREVLEKVLGYKIQLKSADHLKFLAFLDPKVNNFVNIEAQYSFTDIDTIKVSATLKNSDTIFFKFKGIFSKK